jgi:hypothetical protein
MVTTILTFASRDFQNATTTGYPALVGDGLYSGSGITYAEALIYANLFENATFGGLYVSANTGAFASGNSTVTLRKNAANTAMAVSIPPLSFGTFADNVDTASGASGDSFNYAIVCGGASSNATFNMVSCVMASAHTTSWMNGTILTAALHPLNYNSGTVYGMAGGSGDWIATESIAQYTVRFALHAFGMYAYVTNNTINNTTTFKMRKNGANGNQSVSIGASATGTFTDTIDTDDFAYGDKTSYGYTPSGTAGSMDTCACTVTCYSPDGVSLFTGLSGYMVGNGSATSGVLWAYTGDGFQQGPQANSGALLIRQVSANGVYLAVNVVLTGSFTLTVNSQVSLANANMAISTSANGYFEDLVDSDSFVPGQSYGMATSETGSIANNYTFYLSPTAMMQFPPPPSSLPVRVSRSYRHHK